MIREKSVLPTANNPYNEIGKDPCVFSDFILPTPSVSATLKVEIAKFTLQEIPLPGKPDNAKRRCAVQIGIRKTDAPVKPRPLHIPPEATDTDEHTEPKQRHPLVRLFARSALPRHRHSSALSESRDELRPKETIGKQPDRPKKDSGANRNLHLNHNCIHTPTAWTFRVSGEGCAWYRGNVGSSASES